MIWHWMRTHWIGAAAVLIVAFLVAGDIVLHPGPAPMPIVQKSFQHAGSDLREATIIPTPPDSHAIRIDVRISVIPRGTELGDTARSQTMTAMNNRDCALIVKMIAGDCRIENSRLEEIRSGGATTFARYVIEPKSGPAAH